MGRDGLGCGGRAHEDAVRALVLHNRWNVFQSAEDYVVWEVAPARLSDGSVVDLWREESSPIAWQVRIASLISAEYIPHLIGGRRALRLRGRCRRWRAFLACKCSPRRPHPHAPQVPRGDEPRRRRGRWRAFPYTAERSVEASAAFWGVLIATDCH